MAPAMSHSDAATTERGFTAPAAAVGRSATTPPVASFTYWAFISYSHVDEPHAKWLHQSLEGYRVPKALRSQDTRLEPVPARLFPVFRDRDELSAAPRLGERIERALEQSRYLIVICSPAAATSPWVNKEVAFFKALGREDCVLSLIVDGEPFASAKPGQ
jgi:hypothetical protein